MVQALKGIFINMEDWEDYILATSRMSTTKRAEGMIPQRFMEKDGKYSPPPKKFIIENDGFTDIIFYFSL